MEAKYAVGGLNPVPGIIVSGKGSTLIDVDGKEIIDFICMFSAANLGHCYPKLVKAIVDSVKTSETSGLASINTS
ncbi:hypothetical protein NW759_016408 [Fusarium solani]|nr:hypothetical protein NW759_016408 [Fusarium solani]